MKHPRPSNAAFQGQILKITVPQARLNYGQGVPSGPGLSVCVGFFNQLSHGFQSSMRSNDGFAPRFGTFLGEPHRITDLFCFPCFTAFPTGEQSVELFFDERRQKFLRRNPRRSAGYRRNRTVAEADDQIPQTD